MGHVTIVNDDMDEARRIAGMVKEILKVKSKK
jgi:hypothetical protein